MADTTQTSLARRSPLPSPVWLARSWTSRMKEGEPHLYVVLGRWVLVGLLSPVCTTSEQRQHAQHECSSGRASVRFLPSVRGCSLACRSRSPARTVRRTGAPSVAARGPGAGRLLLWAARSPVRRARKFGEKVEGPAGCEVVRLYFVELAQAHGRALAAVATPRVVYLIHCTFCPHG